MAQKTRYFVPVTLSVLLHAGLLATMFVAFDWARPQSITPMAIRATLVAAETKIPPPPVVEKKPEPKPVVVEPEPVVEEPEPEPKPDNSEELRRAAEEEKRVQDALIEKDRLEKMRLQDEADRKQKERDEAQRKKDDEVRKEREREEAERKRQEDIKRQREENERIRRELDAEVHQAEIDAEVDRLAAVDSGELLVYKTMIQQKIFRNWDQPASARADLLCTVRVRQAPGGEVTGLTFVSCNGDDAVKRSIEAAIYKSSPFPEPSNPNLFDRNILLNLTKQQ